MLSSAKSNRRKLLLVIALIVGALVLFAIYYVVPLWKLGCIDSAIGTMRILVNEEQEFAKQHPTQGFGCQLSDFQSNEMLRKLAQTHRRNGYAFEIACSAKQQNGSQSAFQLIARPLLSKLPAYCADQSGILWWDNDGSTTTCLANRVPLNN
jgi:hypothetical protein